MCPKCTRETGGIGETCHQDCKTSGFRSPPSESMSGVNPLSFLSLFLGEKGKTPPKKHLFLPDPIILGKQTENAQKGIPRRAKERGISKKTRKGRTGSSPATFRKLWKLRGNLRNIFSNDPFPNDPISELLRYRGTARYLFEDSLTCDTSLLAITRQNGGYRVFLGGGLQATV